MTLQKRLATAIATGALLANSVMPVLASDTTLVINGNGQNSTNNVAVNVTKSNTVVQNNTADVTNKFDIDSSTGNNSADGNNGGDIRVKSGDSNVEAKAKNQLNTNSYESDCCNNTGDTVVKVSGNAQNSTNNVDLDMNTDSSVFQDNHADVDNKFYVDSSTGDNTADDNNGAGTIIVKSGDSNVVAKAETVANANSVKRNGNGDGEQGSVWLGIVDNAQGSDNAIDLDINVDDTIVQQNDADIYNKFDVDSDTGYNSADDNNGDDGYIHVESGNSDVNLKADNAVNFNMIEDNCGCWGLGDIFAKVDGNAQNSDNRINADFSIDEGQEEGTFQYNDAELKNKFDEIDGDTGYNSASDNNQSDHSDPYVKSGNSDITAKATNTGNVNTIGGDMGVDWDWDMNGAMGSWMAFMGWFSAHN